MEEEEQEKEVRFYSALNQALAMGDACRQLLGLTPVLCC